MKPTMVKLVSICTFILTAFCLGILVGHGRNLAVSSSTVGTHYVPLEPGRQAWVTVGGRAGFVRMEFDNQPNEYDLVVRSEARAGLVHAVRGPLLGVVMPGQTDASADPVAATYRSHGTVKLPDPTATPGVVRTSDASELCAPGFTTRKYRHTTAAMKAQVYAEYGAEKVPGVCCEVDHLIPLELGGADDIRNLWPQPYKPAPGAHEKDRLENYLRELACRLPLIPPEPGMPSVTFEEAQHALQTDWYAAFLKYGLDRNRALGVYNPKRGTHP